VREELFAGDDDFDLDEAFESELDFIFFEDELLEGLLFADELFEELALEDELFEELILEAELFEPDELLDLASLLLFLESALVIFPSVVLVFRVLVSVDDFGIFLVTVLLVFSGLWIFTLRNVSELKSLVDVFASWRALSRILVPVSCIATG
jgi:hypothetical protein